MGNNVTLIPKQPARHSLLTNVENVVYMPLASRHSHGIVKIGDGLNITTGGLLSVDFNDAWYAHIENSVVALRTDVNELRVDVDMLLASKDSANDRLLILENTTAEIPIVYQTKNDNTLVTVNKTVVGGINELKSQTSTNVLSIDALRVDLSGVKTDYATLKYVNNLYANLSMGGNKAYVFETRVQFIAWLDGVYERFDLFKPEALNLGDMILIEEMGVPDYWVKSKSSPMTIGDFREYEAKIEIPEVKSDMISITKNSDGELQAVALKDAFKNIESGISYTDLTGMIRLTRTQYEELVEYGSITVDDEIIVFDEGTLYVVPEPDAIEIQHQLDAIAGAVEMKADRAVVDQNTVDIVELQTTVSELSPKVMRALLTPVSTPSKTELVAVDDGNSQVMLEIGEGLVLENGSLKADTSYPEIVADGVAKVGYSDRVIESYISSDSKTWYRKWISGWKECGQIVEVGNVPASGAKTSSITFPLTFTKIVQALANTIIDIGASGDTSTFTNIGEISYSSDTTSATLFCSNYKSSQASGVVTNYYVCGY